MLPAEKKQLLSLLEELGRAVEELLLAGLTAASKSTVERLDVSFKEASRMRLLRLGSTLRIANEEISRFTAGSQQFSPRRLAFFLGRAWLLASAMRKAIDADDEAGLSKLLVTPAAQPVEKVKVVTLGVAKRVVPGAFASFDFRFRALEPAGEPMLWSCVFPMRKDLDLPAEAFLHLPQKQKFRPSLLLEKNVVEITKLAITRQATGPTRITLNDASEVKAGAAYDDWRSHWRWDPKPAADRLAAHRPTPLDLEIELQEEVFLEAWEPRTKEQTESDGYHLLPIDAAELRLEAKLDHGPSGVPVTKLMKELSAKKKRPPLFGVAHYESCRLMFQPLSVLGKEGPEYLTVSRDKISQAELVKAMKFT
jgi:hypothetical protein